jgi:hypothetical protein
MSHFERNLDSIAACSGRNGTYEGVVYFVQHGQVRRRQVDYGRQLPDYDVPEDLLGDVAARLGQTLEANRPYPLEKIAAVGLLRVCQKIKHDDGEVYPYGGSRMEYLASIALIRSAKMAVPLHELSGVEKRSLGGSGIGYARRQSGGPKIRNLISMPLTDEHIRSNPVHVAIPTYARTNTTATQPHVALHMEYSEDPIERLVQASELGIEQ